MSSFSRTVDFAAVIRDTSLMPHDDKPASAADDMLRALQALGRLPPQRPLKSDGLELVVKPREEGLQEKVIPVDQIVKKLIACRDKLRVLEQRVNSSELHADEKRALEAHITGVYDAFATLSAFFSEDALPRGDREQP